MLRGAKSTGFSICFSLHLLISRIPRPSAHADCTASRVHKQVLHFQRETRMLSVSSGGRKLLTCSSRPDFRSLELDEIIVHASFWINHRFKADCSHHWSYCIHSGNVRWVKKSLAWIDIPFLSCQASSQEKLQTDLGQKVTYQHWHACESLACAASLQPVTLTVSEISTAATMLYWVF